MIALWKRYKKNPIVDLVVTLATAVLIAYVVQLWLVKPYRIPSGSMETTFHISDRVLAARFLYHFQEPSRGDIIVFHPNGQGDQALQIDSVADVTFVKRLIGLPNEWVGASRGKVYTCSTRAPAEPLAPDKTTGCRFLSEPYVSSPQEDFGPLKIPDGRYWMMGDNRSNSDDSRTWGPIKRDQIIGRAFMTYWPLTRIGFY